VPFWPVPYSLPTPPFSFFFFARPPSSFIGLVRRQHFLYLLSFASADWPYFVFDTSPSLWCPAISHELTPFFFAPLFQVQDFPAFPFLTALVWKQFTYFVDLFQVSIAPPSCQTFVRQRAFVSGFRGLDNGALFFYLFFCPFFFCWHLFYAMTCFSQESHAAVELADEPLVSGPCFLVRGIFRTGLLLCVFFDHTLRCFF